MNIRNEPQDAGTAPSRSRADEAAPAWQAWVRNLVLPAAAAWLLWCTVGGGRTEEEVDLPSFWCAAQATFVHGRHPYDLEYLQTLAPWKEPARRSSDETRKGSGTVYPFVYPPPALFIYRPLASLSYDSASAFFLTLNLLAACFLAWYIPARILRASWRREPLLYALSALFVLCGRSMIATILFGQVNLFHLVPALVAWELLRKDRAAAAGLCLALAGLVKTYPLLALPFLAAAGKGRACVVALGALAAAAAASFILLPAGTWEGWTKATVEMQERATPMALKLAAGEENQGLDAMLRKVVERPPEWIADYVDTSLYLQAVSVLVRGGFLLVAMRAVLRRRRTNPADALDWAMLLFAPTMFLVSPLAWNHHLVAAYATILFLLRRILFQGAAGVGWGRLVTLAAAAHVWYWVSPPSSFLPMLVLWCVCLDAAWSDPRPAIAAASQGGPDSDVAAPCEERAATAESPASEPVGLGSPVGLVSSAASTSAAPQPT